MIKKLFILTAAVITVTAGAQTSRTVKSQIQSTFILENSGLQKPSALTTITVNPITTTNVTVYSAGSDTSTPGCSPKAGYVFGSNCYGDLEKAEFYPASSYSAVTSASVVGGTVIFFKSGTIGTGGAATGTTALSFYAGTNNTTAPGTLLATKVVSLSSIVAAQTTTNPFFGYTFTLSTPVSLTGAFYASLVLPTVAGDTAVVANETVAVNNGWEKQSDATWHSIPLAWGSTLKVNLAILPIISGNSTVTGITKNLGLSKNITIMPNPSTGIINLQVALAKSEDLAVSVTNALGQQVLSNNYNGISNELVTLDLTDQSNGVYFVTVSNGIDKMVQRLIISK